MGDTDLECTRAPRCAAEYQSKISGPLLDRIDIQVDVPKVSISDLSSDRTGELSSVVAYRVSAAREIQKNRFETIAPESGIRLNSEANGELLETISLLSIEAKNLLNQAANHMKLSARAYYRMMRLARTIADLDGGTEEVGTVHMSEAISYRRIKSD